MTTPQSITRIAAEVALDAISDADLGPGHARTFIERFADRLEQNAETEHLPFIARQALATKGVAE